MMTVAAWFSRVGRVLDVDENGRIVGLLGTLLDGRAGASSVALEVVNGLPLSRLLLAEEHDNLWWDAEESERERLWEVAAERATEAVVAERLSVGDHERAAIRAAATRIGDAGAIDPSHISTAIEAAMLSLHQNALAELADTPDDHWFRIKHALFVAGRWPLGFRSGRLHIV